MPPSTKWFFSGLSNIRNVHRHEKPLENRGGSQLLVQKACMSLETPVFSRNALMADPGLVSGIAFPSGFFIYL
jgi:hypothetical protein